MPIEEAFVPVLDRGFIFGDGVYEVIPAYSHKPFRLDNHLLRLQQSLDGIRLKNPHSNDEWKELLTQIIAQNEGEDQYLYLHITRGVAKRDHAFPPNVTPTVFIMSTPLPSPPQKLLDSGVAAVTAHDNRWQRCDIKAISLLPNVLLRQLAIDDNATETILIRDGYLTEGAASNIFVVKNDILMTPPKSNLMLPGITYDVVLELATNNHLAHEVRDILGDELHTADEIILTSSTKEVMPITRLNHKPVNQGTPGPIFKKLHELYQQYKSIVMRGNSI